MIKLLKEIVFGPVEKEKSNFSPEEKLKIATCALLIEVGNADDEFSKVEKEAIINIMRENFALSETEVAELIELANQQIEESISLYEFTDIINKNFSREEKLEVVKNIWRLIFADGKLDQYEEYFIRKISRNLNLYHQDFIDTKIAVKQELGL